MWNGYQRQTTSSMSSMWLSQCIWSRTLDPMSPKSCGAWIVDGVLHNNPSRVVISQSQDPASRVKLSARDWCDEYA
jgi:hypothetical protein